MKITSLSTTHTKSSSALVFNIDSPPSAEVNLSGIAWGSLSVSVRDGLLHVGNDGNVAIDYQVLASVEGKINAAQKAFKKDRQLKEKERLTRYAASLTWSAIPSTPTPKTEARSAASPAGFPRYR